MSKNLTKLTVNDLKFLFDLDKRPQVPKPAPLPGFLVHNVKGSLTDPIEIEEDSL